MVESPTPIVEQVFSGMPSPERVAQLEAAMLALPQVDVQTTHVVHAGLCARTIFIPAGTVLTGALMNHDNVCVMHGDITVTTDEGAARLTGYQVIPARAGFKRAGVAHADTWWTTLWPTELTDLDAIEDDMTCEAHLLQTRRDRLEHAQVAKHTLEF